MRNDATFLITGCASGIGRKLSARLIHLGYRVLATDVNLPELKKMQKEGDWNRAQVHIQKLDVRSESSWDRAVSAAMKKWNRLDVLINNAGYLKPGFIHETAAEQIHLHMDINAKGVMLGTRAGARVMTEQGRGHIINIASLAGVAPVSGLDLYSASKFAVRGFSLAAARELKKHGVHLTVICPDAVRTPMLDMQKDYEEAALTFSGSRFLTPDDMVNVILNRALEKRPLEMLIPGHRGFLAKIGNLMPRMADFLDSTLRKKGRKQQGDYEAK